MITNEIDWNRPLQTRDGRKVRIYARDGAGYRPIHGAVWSKHRSAWIPQQWLKDGAWVEHETIHDLITTPAPSLDQISQLTRERDEARKKNETSAKAIANLGAEIARLREELCWTQAVVVEERSELDRMRKALEDRESEYRKLSDMNDVLDKENGLMRKALEDGGPGLIAAERKRQIEKEGWTPEHDDTHKYEEMVWAAVSYALLAAKQSYNPETARKMPLHWPWDICWWKPSIDPIRNLVKAGALIAAEIDRLSRKSRALNPPPAQQENICGFPVVINNKLTSPADKGQSVVFGPVPQEEK